MRDISAEEVHKLVDGDENAVVIDVLSPKSFATKHIPRSVSIPEADPRFLERVEKKVPTKETPVVVYCASPECEASVKAARRLEEAGYEDVREFRGGLEEWESRGSTFDAPSGAI